MLLYFYSESSYTRSNERSTMSILGEINSILFTRDPMRTGCVENKLEDEYMEEAVHINHLIDMSYSSTDICPVVKRVFDLFFWDNCLSGDELADIAKDIQLILAKA